MSIPLPRFHPVYPSGHPLASPAAMLALKDPRDPFVHRAVPPGGPYSPAAFAAYHPYLYGLEGGLRKAAVRETTGPLKAWLMEHKKNPYPTKAEKLMLAIITHMSLTQVSTWFANARRRLKKENKGGWESACSADLDNVSVTDQDGDKAETDNGQDNDYSDVSDDNAERSSTPPPAVAGPEHEAARVGSRLQPPAETTRDDLPQALRQYHFHHPALHPYTAHVLMMQPQRHDVTGPYSLSPQAHVLRPEVMSAMPPRTVLPAAFPHRQDVAAPLALRPGLLPVLPRRPELPAPSPRSPEERALLMLRAAEAQPWGPTTSDLLQPLLWPPQLGGHGQGVGLSPGTAGPSVSPRGASSSKPRIWSIANILGREPDTGDCRADSDRGDSDPRVGGAVRDVATASDDTTEVRLCEAGRKIAPHTDSSSEAPPGSRLRPEERTGASLASEHTEVDYPAGKRDVVGSVHTSPRHSPSSHNNHTHKDISPHLHS